MIEYSCLSTVASFKITQTVKTAAAAAKSPQSCPTLCDPIDGSPPGSPVHAPHAFPSPMHESEK